jgi:hypothetical protein
MVWFRFNEQRKWRMYGKPKPVFIKKFQKNGVPDEEYFGPGMYANYLYEPVQQDIRTLEIFPDLSGDQSSVGHIVTNATRSFEIHKQNNMDFVRLIIRATADDIDGFVKSLNVDYKNVEEPCPIDAIRNPSNKQYFFDFELVHQFNFTILETNQEPIINKLIRAMLSVKNCGVMIQFVFTRSLEWNTIAETTAKNLSKYLRIVERGKIKSTITGFNKYFIPNLSLSESPEIEDVSSSVYQTGKKIEKSYHQKVISSPFTLAIRGMAVGESGYVENALQNIMSVFSSVEFLGDYLNCFNYDVSFERGQSWIKNNTLASVYALKILEDNANMWSDMRWGRGRDFVPFLCLTAQEFPIFVSLPTDPTLAVSYSRKRIAGQSYDKMVFPLGQRI